MARRANFAYSADPGAAIGQSIATALFGNPELAAAQAEHNAKLATMDAQRQGYLAQAGFDNARTTGVTNQNNAMSGLGPVLDGMIRMAGGGPVSDDPLAPLPEPAHLDKAHFQASLPGAVAALLQSGLTDPAKALAAITGYTGDDGLGRGAIISQGGTPGEYFAADANRADEIAARNAGHDLTQATSVARINHANDIPVANIQAGASRDVANIHGNTDRDVARINNEEGVLSNAAAVGGTLGTVTSTVRSPADNKRVGGVANSHHLAANGGNAIDIARKPGVTHAQVLAQYKAQGFTIGENLDEGDHSHIVILGGPGTKGSKAAAAKAPAQVSGADMEILNGEIARQLSGKGWNLTPGASTNITSNAIRRFQETGNAVEAVRQTIDLVQARIDGRAGSAPGVPGGTSKVIKFDAQGNRI